MFSAVHLFIIGILAFLLQPSIFQQDIENDICAKSNGLEETAFSVKLEGTKIKAEQIKLMHASSLMKIFHNGTLYMSYQFSARFTYEASVFLLSHYTFKDRGFAAMLCAFYGGHLLEITGDELYNEIKQFVSVFKEVQCIILGSTRQTIDGVDKWIHEFSGLPADNIFIDSGGYPTSVKLDKYARMVRIIEEEEISQGGEWSVQNGPSHGNSSCFMICQVPK